MNALLSVIITSQIYLFRKKIQSFQIDEFVKSCSIIYSCFTSQFLYQKINFIRASFCLRLIFMLRMLCWRKYSVIFSILDIIWNRSKRVTFIGILVFPSKIFLDLSNVLMLKTQLCQKAPFHATTVDISLIELFGLQISKNWLFSVVVKYKQNGITRNKNNFKENLMTNSEHKAFFISF